MRKIISILLLINLLNSCCKTSNTIINEIELESKFTITTELGQEEFSYGCYELGLLGSRSGDIFTDKLIYEQANNTRIVLSTGQSLRISLVIYTETSLELLTIDELRSFLIATPETLDVDIELIDGDNILKNQFVELVGFGKNYENRKIVADDQVVSFMIGDTEISDCNDGWPVVKIDVTYSGTLKTEAKSAEQLISFVFETYLIRIR